MNCGQQEDNAVRPGHALTPSIAAVLKCLEVLRIDERDLRIDATFSEDCRHRYVWRLRWSDAKPPNPLLVVGLIPSTADERQDDATVRKCMKVAAHNGHTELVMLNLFSRWPTSDHRDAVINRSLVDLVGPANDQYIGECATEVRGLRGTIVAAWGNDGWSRHAEVLSRLGPHVHCFGTQRFERKNGWRQKPLEGWTGSRFPRHASLRGIPPKVVEIVPYPWAAAGLQAVQKSRTSLR